MINMLNWIDIPPSWLTFFLAVAWVQAEALPLGLNVSLIWVDLAAGLLVGCGVILIALAAFEMRRHKTTILPHSEADRLVQSGVFSRSRNPIYLGDFLILAGMILYWDAVLALLLIPIFVWVIERRFVLPEEERLRRKFRLEFAHYEKKVRRWM